MIMISTTVHPIPASIKHSRKPDTRQIIVDASGISSIDLTAADRLVLIEQKYRDRGIQLYLAGHVGDLNDQLRQFGADALITNGTLRKTISLALRDCGMDAPYDLEGDDRGFGEKPRDESESYVEFEWLYGDDAEEHFDALAKEIAAMIIRDPTLSLAEAESRSSWGRVGLFDEDSLLDYIELNLEEMAREGTLDLTRLDDLETYVEQMQPSLDEPLSQLSTKTREYMRKHSEENRKMMAEKHPEQYDRVVEHRKKSSEQQRKEDIEDASKSVIIE